MTTAKLPIYDAFCCSCYTACSLVFRKIINFLTRPIVRTSKDSSWYFKPNSQFCTLNKVIFNLLLLHIWKDLNIWIRVNSVNSYVDQYFSVDSQLVPDTTLNDVFCMKVIKLKKAIHVTYQKNHPRVGVYGIQKHM